MKPDLNQQEEALLQQANEASDTIGIGGQNQQ